MKIDFILENIYNNSILELRDNDEKLKLKKYCS